MGAVVVNVHIGSYRAVVHYESCRYVGRYLHTNLPIPPSITWKLCSFCKPLEEDIALIARDIQWLEKKADALSIAYGYSTVEELENMVTRTEISGGRTWRKKQHD